MDSNILIKLNILIDGLNNKQKLIARETISKYIISELGDKLYVNIGKDKYEFLSFVKSKCNC